jgi:hypothetical protein
MGFRNRDLTNKEHMWKQVFKLLADMAPWHTWEPLFASLFLTETRIAEEAVKELEGMTS